ncbi:MAG TPA: YhbY family RNA-binding protein [Candidatus Onthovicinus excrementipullorum]|mgnify:CR=1 FL=1|nr:YhbY family RNA-binding protein [Candidatus Onthovicinus excrementipullorum]
MTSKERAAFRAQANTLKPLFQAGKGGISDALIRQTDEALTAHELIKIRVLLETTPQPARDIAQQLAAHTGAEVIQVLGGVITLYRYSEELHAKERQKQENIKKAERVRSHNAYERMRAQKKTAFPKKREGKNRNG